MGTRFQARLPVMAKARVTTGFRWAPLRGMEAKTPVMMARPQPRLMNRAPEFCPLVLFSRTLATAPLPTRSMMAVPINSPKK